MSAEFDRRFVNPAVQAFGEQFATGDLSRRRVLDVGCGEGNDALYYAQLGFGEVHGIDAAQEYLGVARQKAVGSLACQFIEADFVHDLGLVGDGKYDVVSASRILSTFPKSTSHGILRGMQQRTVRGGFNVITDYLLTPDVRDSKSQRQMLHAGELAMLYQERGWEVVYDEAIIGPVTYAPSGKEYNGSVNAFIARNVAPEFDDCPYN